MNCLIMNCSTRHLYEVLKLWAKQVKKSQMKLDLSTQNFNGEALLG